MKVNYDEVESVNRIENEDKCDFSKGKPCIICGKTVLHNTNYKMLRLISGGDIITDEQGDFEDDMGWYPVGNSCYRKFLKLGNKSK